MTAEHEPILIAHELTKRYRLGTIGRATLQEELRFWWTKLRGRDPRAELGPVKSSLRHAGDRPAAAQRWITALDRVGFTLRRGETLGLIGRNGAGKTTLLRILSRVTPPTEGRAIIRGRVGALLEVGTGFHPELTGRENIFLNGAILGLRRREIETRFDEIVAFADIGPFLDTPVKRYSSGMFVRLAFAVGAHLEPELLLVDEVLAVGDAAFQRKCLQRMSELGETGRAVIFVSHNMDAVRRLCTRAIVLDQGRLLFDGPTEDAVAFYLERNRDRRISEPKIAPGSSVECVTLRLNGHGSDQAFRWEAGSPLRLEFTIGLREPMPCPHVGFALHRSDGIRAFRALFNGAGHVERRREWRISGTISTAELGAGAYYADVTITDSTGHTAVHWPMAVQGEVFVNTLREDVTADSVVFPRIQWSVELPGGGVESPPSSPQEPKTP